METLTRHISRAAPAAAFALLLVILVTRGAGAQTPPGAEAYHERVAAAIERVPYRIGDWTGRDVEVPPAAQRLLRPNKLMQRRYQNFTTGEVFNVLIVHCKDSRDMVGHYPPVCYPASGWSMVATGDGAFSLASETFSAKEYQFNRVVEGIEQRMRVFSFFVVPAGTADIASDYEALNAASRDRRATGLGAAQMQFIGGEGMSDEARGRIVEEFVRALEPVIRVIGGGVQS